MIEFSCVRVELKNINRSDQSASLRETLTEPNNPLETHIPGNKTNCFHRDREARRIYYYMTRTAPRALSLQNY